MNTSLFAAGDNGQNPNLIYKTVEYKDEGKKQYRKYYFLNNRLCGVILIGDTSRMADMTERWSITGIIKKLSIFKLGFYIKARILKI